MTGKKKLIAPAVVTTLVALGVAGTTFAASGQGFGNHGEGKPNENRPALSTEERAAHRQEMQTKLQEALTSAVTNGKLTEDQKAYILQKESEIQSKMTANDREGAKTLRDELRTWLQENNIDRTIMPGPKGEGKGRGMGQHRNSQSSQQSNN